VEPPVVEALTPPPVNMHNYGQLENDVMQGMDDLAGLRELDPKIIALLRADMGSNQPENNSLNTNPGDYAP
jgi:hypothetical protein